MQYVFHNARRIFLPNTGTYETHDRELATFIKLIGGYRRVIYTNFAFYDIVDYAFEQPNGFIGLEALIRTQWNR